MPFEITGLKLNGSPVASVGGIHLDNGGPVIPPEALKSGDLIEVSAVLGMKFQQQFFIKIRNPPWLN